jgi:hypothetical protein
MYNQSKKRNAMGLSVIPTNIGGVNIPLAQLQGPLSKLFQDQSSQNLVYPADLASNPVMGHAVQFSIFDYTTGFQEGYNTVLGNVTSAANGTLTNADVMAGVKKLPSAVGLLQAKTYERTKKGQALSVISLFMPDTLAVTYNSTYSDVNLTDVLGLKGFAGSAYQDLTNSNPQNGTGLVNTMLESEYAKNIIAAGTSAVNLKSGGSGNSTELLQQALGQYTNPQLQLLYKGISLRQFTLEFIMTPKSTQEAQIVKDICDSFAFYSAPGLAGAASGTAGQYLTPPQIFQIKFKFLGKTGLLGAVSNVFTSAMNNIGLGFLTTANPSKSIESGAEAKIMTINDCVLENVNIDYAPNGWAAYNDGYPIQTRLMLTFKEIKIITKADIAKANPKVGANYDRSQFLNSAEEKGLSGLINGWDR